jgi:hypothetical protein
MINGVGVFVTFSIMQPVLKMGKTANIGRVKNTKENHNPPM